MQESKEIWFQLVMLHVDGIESDFCLQCLTQIDNGFELTSEQHERLRTLLEKHGIAEPVFDTTQEPFATEGLNKV